MSCLCCVTQWMMHRRSVSHDVPSHIYIWQSAHQSGQIPTFCPPHLSSRGASRSHHFSTLQLPSYPHCTTRHSYHDNRPTRRSPSFSARCLRSRFFPTPSDLFALFPFRESLAKGVPITLSLPLSMTIQALASDKSQVSLASQLVIPTAQTSEPLRL